MKAPEADLTADVPPVAALEVVIAARAPLLSPRITWAIVLGFAALGSWRMPYLFGVSFALPALFVVLGWRLANPRARSLIVRFFDDALELDAGEWVERFEWDGVREVVVTPAGFALSLPLGRRVELPKRCVDRTLLERLLPVHVQWSTLEPSPGRPETQGKTLLFVLIVVMALAAAHQFLGAGR